MSSEPLLAVPMYHCIPVPRGDWRDRFEFQALHMVVIHNVIIRSYNSLLYYSGKDQPGTTKFASFLRYCATANQFLHHHHFIEETYLFPYLEERIGKQSMQHNIGEHEEVMAKFAIFDELVKNLQSGRSEFDLGEFRNAIHGFMPTLVEHLQREPNTFRADILRKRITLEDLEARDAAMRPVMRRSMSLVNDAPIFLVNGDNKNAAWAPPIPPLLRFVLKYILYFFHSDMWAFGSTDKHGQVKPEFAEYEPGLEPE